MSVKVLKTSKCANCGQTTSYFIIENKDNTLNLSNYNLFKKPTINVCDNCGYVNDDLENDNIFKNTIKINERIENLDLLSNLKENLKIARVYLNNVLDANLKLRILANIFENNKLVYNLFLKDNYTKQDDFTISEIKQYKLNLKNICNEILDFLNNNKLENDFISLLKIEVLSCLDNINTATKLFENVKNQLTDDLLDFLEECLEIGGLV